MKEIELLAPEVKKDDLYRGVDLDKLTFPRLCTFNSSNRERWAL